MESDHQKLYDEIAHLKGALDTITKASTLKHAREVAAATLLRDMSVKPPPGPSIYQVKRERDSGEVAERRIPPAGAAF